MVFLEPHWPNLRLKKDNSVVITCIEGEKASIVVKNEQELVNFDHERSRRLWYKFYTQPGRNREIQLGIEKPS